MKNNTNYKFFNTLFLKVSVSAKVSAISGIGSIGVGIGEYLSIGIGIGENFGIGAALLVLVCQMGYLHYFTKYFESLIML